MAAHADTATGPSGASSGAASSENAASHAERSERGGQARGRHLTAETLHGGRAGGHDDGGADDPPLRPAPVLERPGEGEQDRHGGHDDAHAAGVHALFGGQHEQVEGGQAGGGQQGEAAGLPCGQARQAAPGEGDQQRRADRVARGLAARLREVTQGFEHGERRADDRHAEGGAGRVEPVGPVGARGARARIGHRRRRHRRDDRLHLVR